MLASVLSPEPKELQQKQEQVLATPTPEVQSKRPETVRSKRDFREHLMSAVNKLQSRMQLHADKQVPFGLLRVAADQGWCRAARL